MHSVKNVLLVILYFTVRHKTEKPRRNNTAVKKFVVLFQHLVTKMHVISTKVHLFNILWKTNETHECFVLFIENSYQEVQ